MPNQITKLTNQMYESFHGPRTVDTDFNLKVEECHMVEKNIHNIQKLYRNFQRNTVGKQKLFILGLKHFFLDVYSTFGTCYENNSPYWPVINQVLVAHQQADALYDVLAHNVSKIAMIANEWDKYFSEVRSNLKSREGLRVAYEHYDARMEKAVKKRHKRQSKNKSEDAHFIKRFEGVR